MAADAREPKYLLLLCTAMYEIEFAVRLREGLAARGWDLVVATHVISVWFKARQEGVPCVLLKGWRRSADAPQIDVQRTHEGRLGLLSASRARRYEACAWAALEEVAARYPVAGVLEWNGQGLAGHVATAFARARNLPCAFVELGNVDGKLFVDPEGVGGAALIGRRPDLLDRYATDEDEIAAWRRRLVDEARDRRAIPQARRLAKINPWYPVNVVGGALLGLPAPARSGFILRLRRQLGLAGGAPKTPNVKPSGGYVFLPLQVSTDTNLLLFSSHDARSAIAVAAARAAELGVQLVIKPHPAERDLAPQRRLRQEAEAAGHLWTGADTIDLILGAEEVVTINSTVGLTAMLLDRPVTVLGRSLYGAFTPKQAAALVLRHLVEIDPFSTASASQAAVDRLLDLMTLGRDQPKSAEKPARRSAIRS